MLMTSPPWSGPFISIASLGYGSRVTPCRPVLGPQCRRAWRRSWANLAPMRLTPPAPSGLLLRRAIAKLRGYVLAWQQPQLRAAGMELSAGTEVRISRGARVQIGRGFVAGRDLTLNVSGLLEIGAGMFCNRGVMLVAIHKIVIGDDVRLGERVSLIDHNHVIEPLDNLPARFHEYEAAPIRIGDRVLIGANCVVLAGATIGDDVVIAAGSVVRGEIPPGVLAAGTPAVVKKRLAPTAAEGGN